MTDKTAEERANDIAEVLFAVFLVVVLWPLIFFLPLILLFPKGYGGGPRGGGAP